MSRIPNKTLRSEESIDFGMIENLPKGAVQFFKIFSRFEFALKECKHLPQREGKARADWKSFASELNETLGKNTFFRYVQNSGEAETLICEPPKVQVCANKTLDFRAAKKPLENTKQLFEAVRCVRNNLFHGGKSGDPDADPDDPKRNEKLIAQAQWVLEEALRHDNYVRYAFENRH